ncbi:MAG: methylmalonyl Co-A mutase-associated GTPase MeaB [Bacteroidetes bacterium]|nr:methylmalonyl Co-A mutase-associated GTPase MeaB [Bacteroidota bacterium]
MDISSFNPDFQNKEGKNSLPSDWLTELRKGSKQALAKALTLTESTKEEDRQLARYIVQQCVNEGKSIRIGITGVPGVGKSTFIDQLGTYLIKEKNKKVAVLAVDPSSGRSGGSVLGDKTRMEKLVMEDAAYIRPIPSRKELGGVTSGLSDAIVLSEEAGFDIVFIETVGVGQSETAVSQLVDIIIFLLLPNSGDDLQGIKRGIMEEVHIVAINKSEGENLLAAKKTKMLLDTVLQIMPGPVEGEKREVLLCSAQEATGIEELWKEVSELHQRIDKSGWLTENRKQQKVNRLRIYLDSLLRDSFYHNSNVSDAIVKYIAEVESGKIDAYNAAMEIFKEFKK